MTGRSGAPRRWGGRAVVLREPPAPASARGKATAVRSSRCDTVPSRCLSLAQSGRPRVFCSNSQGARTGGRAVGSVASTARATRPQPRGHGRRGPQVGHGLPTWRPRVEDRGCWPGSAARSVSADHRSVKLEHHRRDWRRLDRVIGALPGAVLGDSGTSGWSITFLQHNRCGRSWARREARNMSTRTTQARRASRCSTGGRTALSEWCVSDTSPSWLQDATWWGGAAVATAPGGGGGSGRRTALAMAPTTPQRRGGHRRGDARPVLARQAEPSPMSCGLGAEPEMIAVARSWSDTNVVAHLGRCVTGAAQSGPELGRRSNLLLTEPRRHARSPRPDRASGGGAGPPGCRGY